MRVRFLSLCIALSFGASCSTPPASKDVSSSPRSASKAEPLRVGVTPNFPPLIFNQQRQLAGVEVELMKIVGRSLNRPVRAVVLPWEEMIDELLSGNIDVIMSGMTVTPARNMRIAFTESWMRSGLTAMMRQRDAVRIESADDVRAFNGRIGAMEGTTGHEFVLRACPQARLVLVASPGDAAVQLSRNQIDIYVDDIPSILWQVSANEAELAALMDRLTVENIAWGVRRDRGELLDQLNGVIQEARLDGTLDKAIMKWIPYYDSIR
jgi:ABC-type amino acid transport substrate-binding protein